MFKLYRRHPGNAIQRHGCCLYNYNCVYNVIVKSRTRKKTLWGSLHFTAILVQ